MRKHDKNKTRMLEYIQWRLYLFIKCILYSYYVISFFLYIVILFYISKTSIDRKISNEQKQNSMGKILIYLDWKDVLLIKSSKFSISKTFSISVVWNIWWILPLGVNLMFTALFQNHVKWIFLEFFSWRHL